MKASNMVNKDIYFHNVIIEPHLVLLKYFTLFKTEITLKHLKYRLIVRTTKLEHLH